jgi:hypothetical protein
VDQIISAKRFVAYEFTGGCFGGHVKHDMRPGSTLRQDPRPDFTDHRY